MHGLATILKVHCLVLKVEKLQQVQEDSKKNVDTDTFCCLFGLQCKNPDVFLVRLLCTFAILHAARPIFLSLLHCFHLLFLVRALNVGVFLTNLRSDPLKTAENELFG